MVYSLFFNPKNPPPHPPTFYANRKKEERSVRTKHRDRDIDSQWLEKVENWVNAVFAVQYHESVRKLSRVPFLGMQRIPQALKVTSPPRALFCKRLSSPGIDSKESIPPAYVSRRAGTQTSSEPYPDTFGVSWGRLDFPLFSTPARGLILFSSKVSCEPYLYLENLCSWGHEWILNTHCIFIKYKRFKSKL